MNYLCKGLFPVITLCLLASTAGATPDYVRHDPALGVYGETADITMREPEAPREGDAVIVWIHIGYQFWYDRVAVYYTMDGSEPQGSKGNASGSTQVLRSETGNPQFVRNENTGGPVSDWWKATLPPGTSQYGVKVRYKIGSWHSGGGPEVFANNTGCADGTCDDPSAPARTFEYRVNIAWPGRGSAFEDHANGYPPIHIWKEEAIVGNGSINTQIDQNGSLYDVYYPSAGCVQGMGTKNEGYVDGEDTFPPGLPLGHRGQMNLNEAFAGLRVDGKTYWMTNQDGSYSDHSQAYITDTNVLNTYYRFTTAGDITVQQWDFSPRAGELPNDKGGQPNRGIHIKRFILSNNGDTEKTVGFYYFGDFALNGGDSYDMMFADASRGAMVAFDNTGRNTSASGEYNPTSFGDYTKAVSVYLAAAIKTCDSVGSAGGTISPDSWRDSSGDNDQGWIGTKITLAPGGQKEVDVAVVGGFDNFAGATGTYEYQIAPALDWFHSRSMWEYQVSTENYWRDWLAQGVNVQLPDERWNNIYKRGLLATALHLDRKGGGVIAGFHNGAYPFIWPRDAVYAAVTLDRTGHTAEAAEVYRFLKDVAYRANESWGKGFWYQKYTTDGYIVWSSPQVDETAVVPWGALFHYNVTGNLDFLKDHWQMVYEAARASSEDSTIDARLYFDDPNKLMYSNNVWEDSWDDFLYSNANVERGLRDAKRIAEILENPVEAALFGGRADDIHSGLIERLNWDGENTDISQLGLSYPFDVFSPIDPKVSHLADRINGVATDRWGNNHPLVNFGGEFDQLVNRYWGDTYWKGGPWPLTTAWYGLYYLTRADYTPNKADTDVHKSKFDLLLDKLGPVGFGAEQIAPLGSLLYPGEADFRLQTAWPNAWESMSTFVDCVMGLLDFQPDAHTDTIRIAPKLPTGWTTVNFNNLPMKDRRINVNIAEHPDSRHTAQVFRNVTGGTVNIDTWLRIPTPFRPWKVLSNGVPVAYSFDETANRVHVVTSLNNSAGGLTSISVYYALPYTAPDFSKALDIAAGRTTASYDDIIRLDLNSNGKVELIDATGILRKVVGLDVNP